jgi:hypothetical protein
LGEQPSQGHLGYARAVPGGDGAQSQHDPVHLGAVRRREVKDVRPRALGLGLVGREPARQEPARERGPDKDAEPLVLGYGNHLVLDVAPARLQ